MTMMTCSDPDCFICRRLPIPLSRAAHANPQASLWILVAIMFGLALALGVAVSGCGSVTPDGSELHAAGGAGGGASKATGGAGSGGDLAASTGGATGMGGSSTAGGADGDAGCVPEAGVRFCVNACPPGIQLASCPVGTVLAGEGGTCPAGKTLVALIGVCVPSDGG